jgi:hypothetical protein
MLNILNLQEVQQAKKDIGLPSQIQEKLIAEILF